MDDLKYYGSMTGEGPDAPTQTSQGGGGDLYAALINLGSTIYASETARNNSKRTVKANKDLAEYAYSQDLAMWNRQNQYNDPAAQMARFKNAGLNPNLVYGSGSASAGNSNSMPKYNAPTVSYDYAPPNIGGALSQYQDFKMRQAQIDNMRAQTDYTRIKGITEVAREELTQGQIDAVGEKTAYQRSVRPYQSSILESESRAGGAKAQMAFQDLLLKTQQEQMNILSQSYIRNQISQQSIDKERKQAQLIFENQKAEWSKMGVTSGDNPILRILVRILNESGL